MTNDNAELEQIIHGLDYLVPMIFGHAQIMIPDQREFIEQVYGQGNSMKPLLDYTRLIGYIRRNPTSENLNKLRSLDQTIGLGGNEQHAFLRKLKKYVSEID
ncbi:hypothetical protein H6503_00595 [Candidatus Woesearchaeota archaeon]|nr:hypothetical protein [Candidatus Woesearchaeota archaeon]